MINKKSISFQMITIVIITVSGIGLFLFSQENYLLFHSLVELLSIFILFSFFLIAMHTREWLYNSALTLLAISSFFVGAVDLVHTLAFKGMNIFPGNDADLPTQLWIAARSIQAVSFAIAPFLSNRKIRIIPVFGLYTLCSVLICFSIFVWDIFPVCYIEGEGLTLFKVVAEYIIIALLLTSLFFFYRTKENFEPKVLKLLTIALVFLVGSELSFTLYIGVYDTASVIGHIGKFYAALYLYKAVMLAGILDPFKRIMIDLKDQIQAVEAGKKALEESENRYKDLFLGMSEGFAVHQMLYNDQGLGVDYRFLQVNPAFVSYTGLPAERCIGKKVTEVLPNTESYWIENYAKVADTGIPIELESYSQELGKHFKVRAFSPEKGYFATLFIDVTEEHMRKEQEAKEKERLAVTLSSIGDGVLTTTIDGNIDGLNTMGEQLLGCKAQDVMHLKASEVIQLQQEFTGEKLPDLVAQTLESGKPAQLMHQTLLINKNGESIPIYISCAPIKGVHKQAMGVVVVFRDVSRDRQMVDAMQQAERMESLSYLAGGLAHDFNNVLTGVFGYAELAYAGLEEQGDEKANPKGTSDNKQVSQVETVKSHLKEILNALDKAKALTQQLLVFGKGGVSKKVSMQLQNIIQQSAEFALSGSPCTVNFSLPDDVWWCTVDAAQISQVINNLVINSLQAMDERGTLMVTAENKVFPENNPQAFRAGEYVAITIKDTGSGISPEAMKHLFDPFYTTKAFGMGMGLATAYSIIEQHGGFFEVSSEVGKGSSFTFYLPRATIEQNSPSLSMAGETVTTGHYLIMDDEASIRDILSKFIVALGFTPILVKDGDEALHILQAARTDAQYSLAGAIFDLTIPGGMGGKEAVVKARKLFPDLPIYASSGYSEDPVIAYPRKFGFTGSLQKPFRFQDLRDMLQTQP